MVWLATGCVSPATPGGGNGGPQGTFVQLTGSVSTLPIPPSATPPAWATTMQINVLTEVVLPTSANSSTVVLQGNTFSTAPPCNYAQCPWGADNVKLDNATNTGIFCLAAAFPLTNESNWTHTYTPILTAEAVAAAKASGSNVATLVAYLLPTNGLSSFGTVTGLNPNVLKSQGLVIGLAGGPQTQATANSNYLLPPEAGVTVSGQNPNVTVYYPNATYTGTGSATSSTGVFLLVGPASNTANISTTVNLQQNPNTNTWAQAIPTTVYPGYVVVQPYAAQ